MTARLRCLCLVLAAGCFPEEQPPLLPPGHDTPVPTTTQPQEQSTLGKSQGRSYNRTFDTTAPTPTTAASNGTSETANVEIQTKPRDLSEELRSLIRNPGACFSKRTAGSGPSSITFSVTVTAMPSGTISRASVNGSGLSAEETTCLRAIAEQARFPAPIDDAPTHVTTTVELREQAPKKATP